MEKIPLVNEVQLMYKRKNEISEYSIGSSVDAVEIFRQQFPEGSIDHREFVFMMCLSQANKVLNVSKISEGGLSSCVLDVRLIFQTALLSNASAIILCHNHPSGSLRPSTQDLKITSEIKAAGKIMKIELLDHIIITSDSYYAFADDAIL